MFVNVIKKFKDKYTDEIRNVGDSIEVTEERLAEILSAGEYVEAIEPDLTTEQSVVTTESVEQSVEQSVEETKKPRKRKKAE